MLYGEYTVIWLPEASPNHTAVNFLCFPLLLDYTEKNYYKGISIWRWIVVCIFLIYLPENYNQISVDCKKPFTNYICLYMIQSLECKGLFVEHSIMLSRHLVTLLFGNILHGCLPQLNVESLPHKCQFSWAQHLLSQINLGETLVNSPAKIKCSTIPCLSKDKLHLLNPGTVWKSQTQKHTNAHLQRPKGKVFLALNMTSPL